VRLTDEEISRIATFRGLSEYDFIQRFTRLSHDRRGLALAEQPNGACVFLDGNECSIQSVKPQQCRDFPNLWRHPDAAELCAAIPREVTDAEYVQLVARVTQRTPESVRQMIAH